MQTLNPTDLFQVLLGRPAGAAPTVAPMQSQAVQTPLSAPTPPPVSPPTASPAPPPPSAPPPAPSAGSRFGQILAALAPAIFANVAAVQGGPLAAAGVLEGYAQAQAQKQAQAQQQATLDAANAKYQDEQNSKAAAARQATLERAMKFKQDALALLPTYTNPAARAGFIRSREQDAQAAFGIPPGWLSGLPPLDTQAEDQKRAQDFITQMIKLHGAKGFNDLVASDPIIQNYNGKPTRVQDILALSGWDAIDPQTGKPMAIATPVTTETRDSDFGSYLKTVLADEATKRGKTPDQLTPGERRTIALQAKREFGQAGARVQSSADQPADNTTLTLSPHAPNYKIAQQLAYGDLTWSQFTRLFAYQRTSGAEKKAIYNTAMQLNPNFSPAKFEAGFKFATNPGVRKQLAALDNVMAAAGDLLKFSDGAERSRWPTLNKAIIRGGLLAGDTKYSSFHAAVTAFADELSGALGFGSATDMSRQMGFDMTNPSLSQDQFSHVIRDVVLPFIQRKRDSLVPAGSPEAMYAPQPGQSPAQAPTLSAPVQVDGFTVQEER